jgi:hypothetical protein
MKRNRLLSCTETYTTDLKKTRALFWLCYDDDLKGKIKGRQEYASVLLHDPIQQLSSTALPRKSSGIGTIGGVSFLASQHTIAFNLTTFHENRFYSLGKVMCTSLGKGGRLVSISLRITSRLISTASTVYISHNEDFRGFRNMKR